MSESPNIPASAVQHIPSAADELVPIPPADPTGQFEIPYPPEPGLAQEELVLLPPPPATPEEQYLGFKEAHAGIAESAFSRRNRQILFMLAKHAQASSLRAQAHTAVVAQQKAEIAAARTAAEKAALKSGHREAARRARQTEKASRSKELADLAELLECTVPTIKWVANMARQRKFRRLVQQARPGRHGKRQQILEALRSGADPREVERTFGTHRTTVARALHQLQQTRTAA